MSDSPFAFHTITGVTFDARTPRAADVNEHDIAWALAHTLRYGGHSRVPINVAAHSINVATLVAGLEPGRPELRLAALLHDAHEAYIGDVIAPVKRLLGSEWAYLERTVDQAIGNRFGIAPYLFHNPIVRACDYATYGWERRDLVGVRASDEPDPESLPSRKCPNLDSDTAYLVWLSEFATARHATGGPA